jgi:hypothetical protein
MEGLAIGGDRPFLLFFFHRGNICFAKSLTKDDLDSVKGEGIPVFAERSRLRETPFALVAGGK